MIPWFVVNPRAGRVRYEAVVEAIRHELGGQDGTISSSLPDPERGRPRLVVVAGGDGTVSRVINRYDPNNLWLGVIPLGSANDLAAELAIPSGTGSAWSVVRSGWSIVGQDRYERIDLIAVNGARFATCGGLGLATDVAALARRWNARAGWAGWGTRRLGPLIYLLATLVEVWRKRRPIEATFDVDGACHRMTLSMVIVSNQAHFGRHFSASPLASNRDGLVNVCAVEAPRSKLRLLWLCFQLFRGVPDRCPEISQIQCESLSIETDRDVTFFGDGEPLSLGRLFRVQVLPRSLRVASLRDRRHAS